MFMVLCFVAFIGCEKNNESNILSNTTWCQYSSSGDYYMYIEFVSDTEVRRYKASANGSISGEMIIGTYQLDGNNVVFNFEKSKTLLAAYIKGVISNDIMTIEYDYGGNTTFKKK
jgi:hypothetical protein